VHSGVWIPSGAGVHVPSAEDPAATEHTSHDAPQAVPQQTPSTQWLLEQTRQPEVLQSWPAASSQDTPVALRGLQLESLAQ
jgi:hypothetical protein